MESRAKLLGHPIHQQLIVLPLGLFITAVILDIVHLLTGSRVAAQVAFWNIGIGVVSGLLAAVFGTIDWSHIPPGTRAKAIGMWHGLGNVVVVALFALSWWLRRDEGAHQPSTLAVAFSVAAIALGGVTGWLGGELVDRLGIGVDPGAHPDAPSSLSGRPASESVTADEPAPASTRSRGITGV
jgi:uncharacterized membrane protein